MMSNVLKPVHFPQPPKLMPSYKPGNQPIFRFPNRQYYLGFVRIISKSLNTTRSQPEYHPSVWTDFFARPGDSTRTVNSNTLNTPLLLLLTEQAREMLQGATTTLAKLETIDALQRLGVDYRFETEIGAALLDIIDNQDEVDNQDEDLHTASLRFRLLRQHGYPLSSAKVFGKFKDEKGKFKEEVGRDVKGLLSLYEAAYYRVNGEELLDEALEFARSKLELVAESEDDDSVWANQVRHSLKWPILKGLPIRESRRFMSVYHKLDGHNEAILKLGKLDFNLLQQLHQSELNILTKWWIDLETEKTLPFARDRVVECYLWPLGGFIKPEHSNGRIFATKLTILTSVLDDIFDVHGTIHELEAIVRVIERWEISDEENVPNYFKHWFKAMRDVFGEIEDHVFKEGRSFCMDYAKKVVQQIVRAFIKEARWCNENYVPTVEEYLENGSVSLGYPLVITIIYCGMGEEVASRKVFEWLFTRPEMLVAGSTIARLMDDLVSNEFEQEREHVASSVECYMKQYGVSKEEAHVELKKLVEKLWRDMNQEMLKPNSMAPPRPALLAILNMVRVMDLVYKDEDTYTNSNTLMKHLLTDLLVHPVTV